MTEHTESSSGRGVATVRRRPMSRRRRRQRILRGVGIYSGVAMMSIWVLLPLYFTIASSFMKPSEIGTRPFHWIPHEPTFKNYQAILEGNSAPFDDGAGSGVISSTDAVERLIPAMGQSVMIGLVVVVVNLIVGGVAAYALSRYPFRGAKMAYLLLLASRVVPAISIISPFFVFFRRTGLLDTPWALIISYLVFTLPLSVWLLKSYFDSVPIELEEAARLDGASRLTCLVRIVVPIARPGLVAAGLLVFLDVWSEFFYALVLTNQMTTPSVIAGLQNLQQFSWTTLAAASMFSLIPPIVLALVFQRYIVSGLTPRECEMTTGSLSQALTVLGPVPVADLGPTLSHDHVLVDGWGIRELYDAIVDDEELATKEVAEYRSVGGGTICDPTNIGLGRDHEALSRISQTTGVHLIMGSGWYRERVYPDYVHQEMPDQLADRLVDELVHGVDGSGIQPGFVGEIGTERGAITPAQERVFRAAGRAHQRTGVPIMTHTTHWGELAIEQIDLLEEEKVPATSIIISHLGDRLGIHWVLPIAARGAWLSVDNLAFVAGYAPLTVRADNVAGLCAEGLSGQILLSNDICELNQLSFYGGCGYGNVLLNFLPMLHERGVSEEHIHEMTVVNPGKAFGFDLSRVLEMAANS